MSVDRPVVEVGQTWDIWLADDKNTAAKAVVAKRLDHRSLCAGTSLPPLPSHPVAGAGPKLKPPGPSPKPLPTRAAGVVGAAKAPATEAAVPTPLVKRWQNATAKIMEKTR